MAKILVVEDDPTLKLTYDILLKQEGHKVERAEDGAEALEKAEASEPDLILLDLMMPKMSGVEFLKKYDVKNKHPKVKIIVFTNMTMPETMEEVMGLGAYKYITKATNSPKQLADVIKEALADTGGGQADDTDEDTTDDA